MQCLRQLTFASLECDRKTRKTRREIFLERMDGLIPWERLEARIAPACPKGGRKGRQPHPLSVMLRVHCVQLFCNLSDPMMEDQLYEAESIRRFAGAEKAKARVEHPFRIIKRVFGCDMVRYRGLDKNVQRLALLPGFSNLMIAQPHLQ